MSKIPNAKNLDPTVMAQLAKLDPGNQYLIPWFWGYTTVGINVAQVKKALGDLPMPEDAWALVFDPKYASRVKSCGVSMLDSGQDIMEAMMVYLGIPVASNNTADFQRAWAELQKIRSYVTLFSSSGYINDLAGGSVCVAWLVQRHEHRGATRPRRQSRHHGASVDPAQRRGAVL